MTIQKIKGKITAISGPREHDGKLQIGFVVKEKWYNVEGTKEGLEEIKKISLIKGNEVEFEIIDGMPKNLKVIKSAPKEEDDMINLDKLLDKAHEKGLLSIKTKIIEINYEKEFAVFKAIVTLNVPDKEQQVFYGHGDANQENCGDMVKKHYIRMAESRSIVRALRFATNNAKVADEEKD